MIRVRLLLQTGEQPPVEIGVAEEVDPRAVFRELAGAFREAAAEFDRIAAGQEETAAAFWSIVQPPPGSV